MTTPAGTERGPLAEVVVHGLVWLTIVAAVLFLATLVFSGTRIRGGRSRRGAPARRGVPRRGADWGAQHRGRGVAMGGGSGALPLPAEPVVRPAPHRWLWYAFGGRLPERNRGWVLHDTTTGTWWLRHVVRTLVQLAVPIALVVALLPAPLPLRLAAAGGGIFLALIFSLAYMPETTENRVVKAGYPAGTATRVRERAALDRQQRETERKRAAASRRAERYRSRAGR